MNIERKKTYLKRVLVSVSGVWLPKCVAVGKGFGAKGWECFSLRVFHCESEWFGWFSVFEGGKCLRARVFEWLIWVWDWVILKVSEWVILRVMSEFESLRVTLRGLSEFESLRVSESVWSLCLNFENVFEWGVWK